MKTALIAIAIIGLAAVAQAEKGPTCKTWVRSPKTCNIPAGTCCGDPYVCNSRTGDGQCDYASSVNKPTTLPGTTKPTTGASTLPASACPTSGCDRICPGQSRGGAPACNCGYTFCSGKCIANDQADKRFQSEGKPIPPCKG